MSYVNMSMSSTAPFRYFSEGTYRMALFGLRGTASISRKSKEQALTAGGLPVSFHGGRRRVAVEVLTIGHG